MSLKDKAIKGFSWTVFEGVFSQGSLFIVGVILARLLSPKDFGVVGIITAIIAVSNSIIEAGFVSALVRKMDADTKDYNTVFYTNFLTAFLLYALLFVSARPIANFFEIDILANLIKVAGIVLIINSITIIQNVLLAKALDFKKQATYAVIASVISGIIAVSLAYLNFGVWSLVALAVLRPSLNSVLLWASTKWLPSFLFSKKSFGELFNYGYKLLISNLINTAYKNIYYFIIGKYFSPVALGYYTRADQFQAPFSANITFAIRRISFPILATYQDDTPSLKIKFIQFLRFAMFINFPIMLGIAVIAKPLVLLLIGEKWETSIFYLQLLCLPGVLYPLQILHLNLLLIMGYSNVNLRLEIIKKIILIPLIYTTVFYGIEFMLYGLVLFAIIEYFLNSYYTRKIIGYSLKEQFKDFIPFFSVSIVVSLLMLSITMLHIHFFTMLLLQMGTGFIAFITLNELLGLKEYLEIKNKILKFLKKPGK